ncbi:MAG TPA: hypothetical protein P5548_03070 [Candidatus Moranbacteria bacterium]|nr:hypothetical protein [Candidatus Moranbacteria bacterium]HRZ33850.1 hypothetical protein [Candidatus Moranbacteria bacterium]
MKHKDKFNEISFMTGKNKTALSHLGEWSVVDFDKMKDNKGKVYYAKKLKDLLCYREKIKRPLFTRIGNFDVCYYLPVILYNPKTMQSIMTLAVADTGADSSSFSSEIAEAIGIDWKKGKKVKGFESERLIPFYAYRVKILMSILNDKNIYEEKIDFTEKKHAVNIVGYIGFFNHYEVVFHPKYRMKYKFINK